MFASTFMLIIEPFVAPLRFITHLSSLYVQTQRQNNGTAEGWRVTVKRWKPLKAAKHIFPSSWLIWFLDNHTRQILCICFWWAHENNQHNQTAHTPRRHPIKPPRKSPACSSPAGLPRRRRRSVWSKQPPRIIPDEMLSCVVAEWFVSLREWGKQGAERARSKPALAPRLSEGKPRLRGCSESLVCQDFKDAIDSPCFSPAEQPKRTHSVAVKAPLTSPLSGVQALIQTRINKSTHRGLDPHSASLWRGICTAQQPISCPIEAKCLLPCFIFYTKDLVSVDSRGLCQRTQNTLPLDATGNGNTTNQRTGANRWTQKPRTFKRNISLSPSHFTFKGPERISIKWKQL